MLRALTCARPGHPLAEMRRFDCSQRSFHSPSARSSHVAHPKAMKSSDWTTGVGSSERVERPVVPPSPQRWADGPLAPLRGDNALLASGDVRSDCSACGSLALGSRLPLWGSRAPVGGWPARPAAVPSLRARGGSAVRGGVSGQRLPLARGRARGQLRAFRLVPCRPFTVARLTHRLGSLALASTPSVRSQDVGELPGAKGRLSPGALGEGAELGVGTLNPGAKTRVEDAKASSGAEVHP